MPACSLLGNPGQLVCFTASGFSLPGPMGRFDRLYVGNLLALDKAVSSDDVDNFELDAWEAFGLLLAQGDHGGSGMNRMIDAIITSEHLTSSSGQRALRLRALRDAPDSESLPLAVTSCREEAMSSLGEVMKRLGTPLDAEAKVGTYVHIMCQWLVLSVDFMFAPGPGSRL
jgi:hypothetical protein